VSGMWRCLLGEIGVGERLSRRIEGEDVIEKFEVQSTSEKTEMYYLKGKMRRKKLGKSEQMAGL